MVSLSSLIIFVIWLGFLSDLELIFFSDRSSNTLADVVAKWPLDSFVVGLCSLVA